MATYTIEPPADSVGFTFDRLTGAVRPASTGFERPADVIDVARNSSAAALSKLRAAHDEDPRRTFLLVVACLAAVVALFTSLGRHG